MVFLDGDRIFCRVHTELFQPFRVHIETSRAILHNSAIPILAFSAQEPIDENLGGIGMRRIFTTPSTPKLLLAGKPSLGAGAGLIGRPALTNGSAWLLPMPKAIASLPLARTSASCRKSRVKKSSCWTNFLRNSSPLTSHMKDHTDCPELGTRGSLKPILSFHLGER